MSWTVPTTGGDWRFSRMQVIGILNATPDSFSDGGQLQSAGQVDARIQEMLGAGVDGFDVGGESTRPGATPVAADVETSRIVPIIEAIRDVTDLPISIDTSKAVVAEAALNAGASLVNDVSGGGDPAIAKLVAGRGCAWILMRHETLVGEPVDACRDQLERLVAHAMAAGVARKSLVLDPGLGFGELPGPDPDSNLALLRGVAAYASDLPVMIGHSRKRFVAALAGSPHTVELDGMTAKLSVQAKAAGAAFVRVHNVAATVEALQAS